MNGGGRALTAAHLFSTPLLKNIDKKKKPVIYWSTDFTTFIAATLR
jgi:hypothetical protein